MGMEPIRMNVTGQRIEVPEIPLLVAGTVDAYIVEFIFDPVWEGYRKVAVFTNGLETREAAFVDGLCYVPWEVLQTGSKLMVGVYGVRGDEVLPTVWSEALKVSPGARPSETALAPTPGLTEQLMAAMGDVDMLQTGDKSSLVGAINEIFRTGAFVRAEVVGNGDLILQLPNGEQVNVGCVVGRDGKSAYQIAVEGGYTGTEATLAEKLAEPLAFYQDTEGGGFLAGADLNMDGFHITGVAHGSGPTGVATNQSVEEALARAVPEKLPNPNTLTFTGAVSGAYDGSSPVTVNIPQGGSGYTTYHLAELGMPSLEFGEAVSAAISADVMQQIWSDAMASGILSYTCNVNYFGQTVEMVCCGGFVSGLGTLMQCSQFLLQGTVLLVCAEFYQPTNTVSIYTKVMMTVQD